jgi:hypothetical protein
LTEATASRPRSPATRLPRAVVLGEWRGRQWTELPRIHPPRAVGGCDGFGEARSLAGLRGRSWRLGRRAARAAIVSGLQDSRGAGRRLSCLRDARSKDLALFRVREALGRVVEFPAPRPRPPPADLFPGVLPKPGAAPDGAVAHAGGATTAKGGDRARRVELRRVLLRSEYREQKASAQWPRRDSPSIAGHLLPGV